MQSALLCRNLLNLTGRPADVAAARSALASPYAALDFERISPVPAGLGGPERELWCDRHWGTARDPHVRRVDDEGPRQGGVLYSFVTPTPPVAFCQTLASQHPELRILLLSQHGEDPTGEKRRWMDGVMIEELTFDLARVVARLGAALERRLAWRARVAAARRRARPAQLTRQRRAPRR